MHNDSSPVVCIYLKDIEGKVKEMRLNHGASVKEFQDLVQTKTGITKKHQSFSFQDKPLELPSTSFLEHGPKLLDLLQQCNFSSGDTLGLNTVLKGSDNFDRIESPLGLSHRLSSFVRITWEHNHKKSPRGLEWAPPAHSIRQPPSSDICF
eukprot:TRINITY_DN43993_c0_g1_i1.p1 TRINITY_DN43993_c0_g1~~TRINITY_DN43993_c0_g1_i1.p1  ORF type:complete len:168 (-),score=3.28 TRINITY_DN43993_c0_g1_i1:248-700(-)